jgi:hypothetical protein
LLLFPAILSINKNFSHFFPSTLNISFSHVIYICIWRSFRASEWFKQCMCLLIKGWFSFSHEGVDLGGWVLIGFTAPLPPFPFLQRLLASSRRWGVVLRGYVKCPVKDFVWTLCRRNFKNLNSSSF